MKYPDIEQPTWRIAILAASLTYLCSIYIEGAKDISLAKLKAEPDVVIQGIPVTMHDSQMRSAWEEIERAKRWAER